MEDKIKQWLNQVEVTLCVKLMQEGFVRALGAA